MPVIKVAFGTNSPYDYNMDLSEPLERHMEEVCKIFRSEGSFRDYALMFTDTRVYITEDMYSEGLTLTPGATIELKKKPFCEARDVKKGLGVDKSKLKCIFDLRSLLEDEVFAGEFLAQKGLDVVLDMTKESTGNILAYAMSALQVACVRYTGFEIISSDILTKLAEASDSTNFNVIKASLDLLKSYCSESKSENEPAANVRAAFIEHSMNTANSKGPFFNLVEKLQSTDVNIQVGALSLISTILMRSKGGEAISFFKELEGLNINRILHRQDGAESETYRKEVARYQSLNVARLKSLYQTHYDLESTQHESMLMSLWSKTFPTEPIEGRFSDSWKKMGFNGKDPSPDFESTGLLGLQNMIYFADAYPIQFKRLMTVQTERTEREYPVAQAALAITVILAEFFEICDEPRPGHWYTILFDHNSAFAEIYCVCVQVFDRMWDDMRASFMDFNKMVAIAKKQLKLCLKAMPNTLQAFRNLAFTTATTMASAEGSIDEKYRLVAAAETEAPAVALERARFQAEMEAIVMNQRFEYLRRGNSFQNYPMQKNEKPIVRFFRLMANGLGLRYGVVEEKVAEGQFDMPFTILVANITSLVTGKDCPDVAHSKKKDDSLAVSLSFALTFKDPVDGANSIHMQARTEEDYHNWVDALKLLLNPQDRTERVLSEIKTLTDISVAVHFVELDGGIVVPNEAPELPPPPPNYNFVDTSDDAEVKAPTSLDAATADAPIEDTEIVLGDPNDTSMLNESIADAEVVGE